MKALYANFSAKNETLNYRIITPYEKLFSLITTVDTALSLFKPNYTVFGSKSYAIQKKISHRFVPLYRFIPLRTNFHRF